MQPAIPELIADAFKQALAALNHSNTPFTIGGAFAMYHYSRTWRYTHDLDIYLERRYVPQAIRALSEAGFHDYGEMAQGDREWIYHAVKDDALVDLIWQPPNHLTPVDESFYARATDGRFLGKRVRFIPADELVLAKIFTMNRHRCDWLDLFHIVLACPKGLDWEYLMRKMGEHWPVLLSFIILYDWAFPGKTKCIPDSVRGELWSRKQLTEEPEGPSREEILDPWIHIR
jgi:hypothetical protein